MPPSWLLEVDSSFLIEFFSHFCLIIVIYYTKFVALQINYLDQQVFAKGFEPDSCTFQGQANPYRFITIFLSWLRKPSSQQDVDYPSWFVIRLYARLPFIFLSRTFLSPSHWAYDFLSAVLLKGLQIFYWAVSIIPSSFSANLSFDE